MSPYGGGNRYGGGGLGGYGSGMGMGGMSPMGGPAGESSALLSLACQILHIPVPIKVPLDAANIWNKQKWTDVSGERLRSCRPFNASLHAIHTVAVT